MKYTFKADHRIVATVPGVLPISELCLTVRTISSSLKSGIQALPSDNALWAIVVRGGDTPPDGLFDCLDTRLHRLMPGMFPAIPGWHCDDVPRPTYDSQPRLDLIDPRVRHWTVTLATDPSGISRTEFVTEDVTIDVDESRPLWRQVHDFVERERPRTMFLDPGKVCEFSSTSIHRATATTVRGWRWWARVSWRKNRPTLVNTAEQVYILSEANGW